MSTFPPEIWLLICPYLSTKELCSLRLASRASSAIAAEHLIPCLRIETSLESLERLRSVADHPTLHKGVRHLTYEAGLLANIGCVHRYKTHYQVNHHDDLPAPEEPRGKDITPRAKRLYDREEKKFDAEIQARFARYRDVLDEQQSIRDELLDVTKSTLAKLKLNRVTMTTGAVCAHVYSQQFRKKYCTDCAIPLSTDPDHSIWQFPTILVAGLTELSAQQISLKIFGPQGKHTKAWLLERFAGLERLRLEFKQGREADGEPEAFEISDSWLAAALEASSGSLTRLSINFDVIYSQRTHAGKLENLITAKMPNLRNLDIGSLTTTEDSLIALLKDMPKLKVLFVAFIELSQGLWQSTTRRLRTELNLTTFVATGLLEDSTATIVTDFCDREMWRDGESFTLTSALDLYVTDKEYSTPAHFDSEEDFEMCCNPFARLEDFEDEEELTFELGPIDGSDFDDDDDDDDDDDADTDSDEEKTDEDMPDLDRDENSGISRMEVD